MILYDTTKKMNPKYTWNLSDLYNGFEDPKFIKDMKIIQELQINLPSFCNSLPQQSPSVILHTGLLKLEIIQDYRYRLNMYAQLRLSVDANNTECKQWANKIQAECAPLSLFESKIYSTILNLENLNELIENDELAKKYRFILNEKINKNAFSLSDEQEQILSLVYPTSLKAFSDMYYSLTSNAKAYYDGKWIPLTKVKNMCHDASSTVRKNAFLAEQKAYQNIEEPLSFAISSIKQQQLMESKLRGYKDPLEKMLIDSRMSKNTLHTMMSTIEKYLPFFRSYLRKKAELLGYKNGLPWYEIYATLGENNFNFSIEDCEEYILKHFKKVGNNLYQMTKKAFDEHWIDYLTYEGKQSGAFCENLGWIKQSRIITNYNNTLSDIVTVAHELGHAFHGMMIENQPILNRDYCMPLAETASTFNENIIYNALAKDMNNHDRLLVIDSQLSALCQNILDIYARFQFEKSVFEHVENGFLSAAQLCDLMKQALLKSFGDGLDPEWLHPYRWITKVHYYIPNIAYYNFPYTFGALFSRGLYAKYTKEGNSFIPKYEKLLSATTTNTVEDVAAIAGIDLTTPKFWEDSLQSIADQMMEFLELAKEE